MSVKNKTLISEELKGKSKSKELSDKKAETLTRLAAEGKHYSQIKLTCLHCGTVMQNILCARRHGNNCKSKI